MSDKWVWARLGYLAWIPKLVGPNSTDLVPGAERRPAVAGCGGLLSDRTRLEIRMA